MKYFDPESWHTKSLPFRTLVLRQKAESYPILLVGGSIIIIP